MQKAWESLRTSTPLSERAGQTFIVGTDEARRLFCPSFSGELRTAPGNALTADTVLLRSLRARATWRWVAVVRSAGELRAIADQLPDGTGRANLIVAGARLSEREMLAVRVAALVELGGVGVVAIGEGEDAEGGEAGEVVRRVLRVWGEGGKVGEEAVRRAWGEAKVVGAGDVVVPPGWDSEGKIRAVADAAGVDFEGVVAKSSWHGGEVPRRRVRVAGDMEEARRRAKEVKRRGLQEHREWMERFAERLAAGEADGVGVEAGRPGVDAEGVREVTGGEESAPQSDFFQKLLSVGKQ